MNLSHNNKLLRSLRFKSRVSSDNRRVLILVIQRTRIGAEGTGSSSTSSVSYGFTPLSEPIEGLYDNIVLAKSLLDDWRDSYTSKGKRPPKGREQVGDDIVSLMVTDDEEYNEVITDGVVEYMTQNLKG